MSNTILRLDFSRDGHILNTSLTPIPSETNLNLYEFKDSKLFELHLISGGKLKEQISTKNHYDSHRLHHVFSLDINSDLLIATSKRALLLYISDSRNLTRIFIRNTTFNWNEKKNYILSGRFYENFGEMWLIVISPGMILEFLKITNERNKFRIDQVSFKKENLKKFCPNSWDYKLVNLKRTPKQMLIKRDVNGLCVFEFKKDKKIEFLGKILYSKIHGISENDQIFFANLIGKTKWMEMLVFNPKGLFLFKFQKNSTELYELIKYSPRFSFETGWMDKHTQSVQITDIDNDSFDEIIFTGPAGIEILSYDINKNIWKSLLSTSDLTPQQRYVKVLHILPPVEGVVSETYFITSQQTNIYTAKIIKDHAEIMITNPINQNDLFKVNNAEMNSKIFISKDKETRSTIYLRDQKSWLPKSSLINPQTGKPYISLPLVNDNKSGIKFHLNYEYSKGGNEPFALGWSMPQNFIAAKYEDGNFQEDESYILVVDNFPHKLQLITSNSTSKYLIFGLDNSAQKLEKIKFRATYYISENSWHIDFGTGHVQFYGIFQENTFGAVVTDIAWKNWRGLGFDSDDLVERTNMWYLGISETKEFRTYYEYEIIRSPAIKGKGSYIAGVFLKKIDNIFSDIEFFYNKNNNRTETEKNIPNYLSSYIFKTKTNEQKIHFKYAMSDENLLLLAIEQESDYIAKPIIKFDYNTILDDQLVLSKVILPTGTEFIYNFGIRREPFAITEKNSKRIVVSDDYNVSHGSGFILVSYIDTKLKRVIVRMFTNDLYDEIQPSLNNTDATRNAWTILGQNAIAHEILLGDSYMAVVVYNSKGKSVHLFGRRIDGSWMSPPHSYEYSDEATVLRGSYFIVVSDPYESDIFIIEWHQSEYECKIFPKAFGNGTYRAIAVYENKFLVYDNREIVLGYKKSKTEDWILKTLIRMSGGLSDTLATLNQFDLKSDLKKVLFGFFKNNAIQFRHNLIVFAKFYALHNQQLFATEIKLYTIGRNHEIVGENQTIVDQDVFHDLESDLETNDKGDTFTLKYSYEKEKFRIVLGSFHSPSGRKRDEFNDTIAKGINSPADRFLLDLKNYYVHFQGQTIQCRNVKLTFGGIKWHLKGIERNSNFKDSMSVRLGSRFFVNKTDVESSVILFDASNNEELLNLGVKEVNRVQIHYPIYMASQKENGPITLIEFVDSKKAEYRKTLLPESKKLSPFGNSLSLITHETDFSGNMTLDIWPLYSFRRFLPNFVVNSIKTIIRRENGSFQVRSTGYEYKDISRQLATTNVHYDLIEIIPGNRKTSFGYTAVTVATVNYYNDKNELVKITQKDNRKHSEQIREIDDSKKVTSLYISNGPYEIANFAPFSITSDMSDFIGFEDNEPLPRNWIYEDQNIVRGMFSLTGSNYLALKNSSIRRKFYPTYQDRPFLASCWIRTEIDKIPKLGDIVPFMRLIVITPDGKEVLNFLADVKYLIDDWSYLEVILDMKFTHLMMNAANQSFPSNLEVDICISPSQHVPIDVDHIRFSSLNNIFEVNVYDDEVIKPTAIIRSSGAITRQLHDKYQVQVAIINESNQIAELTTYTKGSYTNGRFGNPPCVITIIPVNGFYENFSTYKFHSQWSLTNMDHFHISPATLHHHSTRKSKLTLLSRDIQTDSSGIRFIYSFTNESSIVISSIVGMRCLKNKAEIELIGLNNSKQIIPFEGEFLLLTEKDRIIVWVDGGLYIDQAGLAYEKLFEIVFEGNVKLEHMMLFNQPQVHVVYKNSLDEDIQKVSLLSASSAILTEMLYDELGRQTITVQPVKVIRTKEQSLLAYDKDFVTNDDPNEDDSVWVTGKLKGEISDLAGHEYAYSRITYENNPLNVKTQMGMPGKEFSINEKYSRRFRSSTLNRFITEKFPLDKNFTYKVQYNDYDEKIDIFDEKKNKIASYIDVKNGKDLFSTFEYNEMGLMVKCRPPEFFNIFGIFDKTSLDLIGISTISPKQHPLETNIEYDGKGNPIRKTTPDAGPLENVYDHKDQLRFTIQYGKNETNTIETIIYFIYDNKGRLTSTGNLNLKIANTKEYLLKLDISEENGNEFQRFYYSDSETDPVFRGKMSRAITMYQDGKLYEESLHDYENNLISKRYIYPKEIDETMIFSINKIFLGGKLKEIIYPATMFGEIFRVAYEYDKLGRMISVRLPERSMHLMWIFYNTNNQISEEFFSPLNNYGFVRSYNYNEPGFLTKISDKFLSEEISYIDKTYEGGIYGDGRVTRVKFHANWHNLCNRDGIGILDKSFQNDQISKFDSHNCFHELKREGFLNEKNQQNRIFNPNLSATLSFACTNGTMERRVKEILGKYGYPKEYGFRFAYGRNDELKKAKYFVGNLSQEREAFQPDAFAKRISGIDRQHSEDIWNLLKSNGYISEGDKFERKSVVRQSLLQDLRSVNSQFANYAPFIEKLLLKLFIKRRFTLEISRIKKIFPRGYIHKTSYAKSILDLLSRKNYLLNPIEPEFIKTLAHFSSYAPEIVSVLFEYQGIGQSEFDMESKEIDFNGNRVKFNVGFENYNLVYEPNSNRIQEVIRSLDKEEGKSFLLYHDSRGNVIIALHKGIDFMEYHPVSNRLQMARMTNGNTIEFQYDSKGERLLKRVTNQEGKIKFEMHYLRDDNGRTLVEKQITYVAENQNPDILVTIYVYGSKNLIGFVRRDQFYSVFTDHQGSVRLVVRDSEVVAAYDYMPYGSLMRIYGNDSDAHIFYRYTGQEWDPELGLYNYHSRLYDPAIGRYYQIDPKMQYFSPYKYAGNSPVSLVDPRGSFAIPFLWFVIGLTILGAYLAASAENDTKNVLKWKWNAETYLAIFVGGVTGALIPLGISGSLAALSALSALKSVTIITSLGLSTTYLSMAAANKDWNPGNWDYDSPKTWWAAFEGFSLGVGIISTYAGAITQFIALSRRSKYLFAGSVALFGGISTIVGGISTEWDISNPEFLNFILTGFVGAADLPMFSIGSYDFLKKQINKIYENRSVLEQFEIMSYLRRNGITIHFPEEMQTAIGNILKTAGKLTLGSSGFILLLTALVGLSEGELDFTKPTAYHNLVSVTQLTANAFDSTKVTIEAEQVREMLPKRLKELVDMKSSFYATALASLRSGMQRFRFRRTPVVPELYLAPSSLALLAEFSDISLIYTNNRFINPFFFNKNGTYENLSNSKMMNDSLLIQKVIDNIGILQNHIEQVEKKRLLDENISQWEFENTYIPKILSKEEIIENYKELLQGLFQANITHINRDLIKAKLNEMNFQSNHSRITIRKQNYSRKLSQIQSYKVKLLTEKDLKFWQQKELSMRNKFLENQIKNLVKKEQEESALRFKTLFNILWDRLKVYEKSIVKWEIKNCAEPPILMVSGQVNRPSQKYITVPNLYENSEDFECSSSLKLEDIPQLTGFEMCYTCIKATTKTRTKIRDVVWLAMLNEKFITKESMKDYDKDEVTLFTKKIKRSIDIKSPRMGVDQMNHKLKSKNINKSFYGNKWSHANPKLLEINNDPLFSSKWINASSENSVNLLQFGDEYFSQLTSNKSLFLADVLLAKCGKRKMFKRSNASYKLDYLKKQELVCKLMDLYEEFLKKSAKAFRIDIDLRNESNAYELYEEVVSVVNGRRFEKVFDLILKFTLNTFSDRSSKFPNIADSPSHRQLEIFAARSSLTSEIDEILIKAN